jgi:hypothetical protein
MCDSTQEEMGEAVRFLIIKSGPTVAVERVANGFIVRIRKIKKVPVPLHGDPVEPWAEAARPPMFEQAPYEEKFVCLTVEDMLTRVREHFEELEKEK